MLTCAHIFRNKKKVFLKIERMTGGCHNAGKYMRVRNKRCCILVCGIRFFMKRGMDMAKKRRKPANKYRTMMMEYGYILAGSAIVAITFNVFLLPNNIASGGVSGISTIFHGLFGWKPAYVQWGLNIPLFLAGLIF